LSVNDDGDRGGVDSHQLGLRNKTLRTTAEIFNDH